MSKLIPVTDLRAYLDWDDDSKLTVLLDSALETSTALLISRLRTGFDRVTDTEDVFYVRWSIQFGTNWGTYLRLRTSNLTAATVTVQYSSSTDFTDATTLASTDFTVDRPAGVVTIRGIDMTDFYVKVTYTAGFTVDAQGVYASVPNDLQAIARLQAVVTLFTNSPKGAMADSFDITQQEVIKQQLDVLLKQYQRYYPSAERPI